VIDDGPATAASESEEQGVQRRRTVAIWLILAFMCFSVLNTLTVVVARWMNWVPWVSQISLPVVLLGVVSSAIDFAAGLALFNLRLAAVRLLIVGMLVSVVSSLLWVIGGDPSKVFDFKFAAATFNASIAAPLIIYGAIVWYAIKLQRQGILR